MAGRRTKRTPETVQLLEEALTLGTPVVLACKYAGIHQDTYFTWCKVDPVFDEAMTRARTSSVVRNLAMIAAAAPQDWRAAEALLRLTHPHFFSKAAMLDMAHQQASEEKPDKDSVARIIKLVPEDMRQSLAAALEAS